MRRALLFALFAVVACSSPLAQLDIEDIRLTNPTKDDKHLAVEVDVRATEGGGGNVGVYCVAVTFAGQTQPQRVCNDDLTDGDTRTVRIVSETPIQTGGSVFVAASLANYIDSELRSAP